MIAYDPVQKRLALFTREATPEFWDEQWNKKELLKNITSGNTYHFLKRMTTTYVPMGGRMLEGGCGTGQVVYAMNRWGYEAYGVDNAGNTVQTVNELVPHLRITRGDVRKLDFPDNHFDGYWSLGVIEHFWDGFQPITSEAARVLKPGGFLFLTFPWMSPLRQLKARLGLYPNMVAGQRNNFYEFIFDKRHVLDTLNAQGFVAVESYSYDALKGMKDEFPIPGLNRLYHSRSKIARALRGVLTVCFAPLTGHMILLVLRKN